MKIGAAPLFAPLGLLWVLATLLGSVATPVSAGISLTDEQRAWLDEHPVIRLAPDPDFAPIEFFEGDEYAGIAADYVDLIEDALGIEFEIVHLPDWAEVVAAAKSREIDMYGAAMESPERLEYMLFTEPHIQTAAIIIVREDTTGRRTLEQMEGQRVAVVQGYVVEEHLWTNHPQVTPVPVSSTLDALRAVSYGEVDAMVGDEATASQVILEAGITNLRVAGEAGLRVNLAIASRSDWPELNELLNEALASIPLGERRAIRQRWISLSGSTEDSISEELGLTAQERQWLTDHPVIRLGPYAHYPPAEFVDENGVHRGIAADYVRLIEERLGIEFEHVPTDTWQDLLDAARAREIDFAALIVRTPEREQYLDFTEPYLELPVVIVAQTGADQLEPEDLSGRRVAVVEGYAVQEYLEANHPEMVLVPVRDDVTGLRMLSTGGVEAMVSDLIPASYHIENEGITNLTVAGELGYRYIYGLACRSDWPEFRSILDKALASITPGERGDIRRRWIRLRATVSEGGRGPSDELNLTEEEREWLREHQEIRLGPYADYPPAEFVDENGVHRGIAADYMRLIEDRLGIDFTHVPTDTWQDLIDAAKARDIDVLALIAWTPEREEYLAFTEPYLRLPAVIIAQTGTRDLEPSDLDGARVAVVEGYAVQEYLERNHPSMVLVPVPDNVAGLRMVSTGGVKAFISDLAPATYHIEREGITNLSVVGESGYVYVMGIACRNDWPELRSILDKALASMTPEERRTISHRWLSLGGEEEPLDRWVLMVAGLSAAAVLAILAVIALWIRRMRGEIRDLSATGGLSLGGGESFRGNRRRILGVSLATLALTALLLGLVTNWVLYRAAFHQREQSLIETTDSQARLIEAVARFDAIHSQEAHPEGAAAATLQQVVDAHNRFSGLGRTGEFIFGTLRNDHIVFLLTPRHAADEDFTAIPFDADGGRAEPMRRALRGESGTMVGLDYRGVEVLAAHQPIEGTGAGIVAKVDLAEVRAPFVRAAVLTLGLGIGLILLGGLLIAWTTTPLLRRIEESEAQFRTLVGNIPGVTYRCQMDKDWTMLFMSEGVEELTGHPASDFIQNSVRTFESVIHPDDRARVAEQVESAVGARRPWTIEYRVTGPRGETRWVQEKGRADVGPKGEVHWLDGAIFDITDRKAAEEELRKFSRAVEQTPSIIFMTDTEGKIIYVNEAFTQVTGHTSAEALGQTPRLLKSGVQATDLYAEIWRSLLSGEGWQGELCNRKKNGDQFWVQAALSPLRDAKGVIRHFLAIEEDITERKIAERRFQGLIESAPDGMVIIDATGKIVMVNAQAERLFGFSREEMLDQPIEMLIPDRFREGHPASVQDYVRNPRVRDMGAGLELFGLRKDGTEFPVEISLSPLETEEGTLVSSSIRDITERKKAEEALRKLNRAVEQSSSTIVITDTRGTIEYVNPMFTEMTGYTPEEAIGNNPRVLKSGDQPPEFYENLWNTINSGEVWRGEFCNRKKNGELFYEAASIAPIRNDAGEITHFIATKDDITERKRLEEAILRSQRLLRGVMDSTDALVFIKDLEDKFLMVNRRWSEVTGFGHREAIGKTDHELLPKEVADLSVAHNEEVKRTKRLMSFELDMAVDGEMRTFLASRFPLLDEKGEVFATGGSAMDITERKRAEEAVARAEERSRLLLESTREGIFGVDSSGTVTFVNPAATELLGFSQEELLGNQVHSLIHHSDREGNHYPVEKCPMHSAYTEGLASHVDDEVLWRKDGTGFDAEYTSVPIRRGDQNIGAVVVFRDITERKKMEGEIKRVNFLSDIALKLTGCGYWHVDYSDPDYYYQSDRAAQILGEPLKEDGRYHLQREWFDRLLEANPETAKATEERYLGAIEGRYEHYESTYAYKRPIDGEIVWVHALGDCVRNEKGEITFMYGVYQDITELKRYEADLVKAREEADTANAAKSEFLANMSHEIRTPMNAILGFSDLLRQSDLSGKDKSHLDAIRTSGKALLALINDILDLSKVEAGKLELQYEAFSLPRLLKEIKTLFDQRALQRGITLTVDTDAEMPEWVYLDEVRLRQILFNIVGNAMKFTHEGGVTLRARGEVNPHQTDHMHLRLEVQDTGIGIPEDQQARIFESFSQVSGQSTRKYGGTGLGLAISKRLAEMMGGTVSLESEAGVGSTFIFDFPDVTLTAPQELEDDAAVHRLDDLEPAKILCADDEPLNRALIEGYFEGSGHTLLLAENGKEAVEITQRERPDLILMDIRMPVMSGLEATRLIKAQHRVPVLALTASSMTGERNQVEEICDLHLSKPISASELARAMKRYLPSKPGMEHPATEEAPAEGVETPEGEAEAAQEAVDTSQWPALLPLLHAEMEGDWKTLCDTPGMDELEAFGNRLGELAEKHAAPPLARYARALLQRVEEFDIENLPATVRSFEGVVEEISAKVESQ